MNDREKLIDSLREFASFLENNPEAPTPVSTVRFDVFCIGKDDFAAAAKHVGGKLNKMNYANLMCLRREFGPLQYDLNVSRDEICERVVTGTRIVPAIEAIPEHEEEIVEWKCGTVLV